MSEDREIADEVPDILKHTNNLLNAQLTLFRGNNGTNNFFFFFDRQMIKFYK